MFAKDDPDAPEWVCYDSPDDVVQLDESVMFQVLDRIMMRDDLSYTECQFEQLDGKLIKKEQPVCSQQM